MNKFTCEHAMKIESEEADRTFYFCELSEIIDDDGTKRYFLCYPDPRHCPLKVDKHDDSL